MAISLFLLVALLLWPNAVLARAQVDEGMLGFSAEAARKQRELEGRFDASLRKEELREWMRWITAKPHHVGSPFGKEVAEFIAGKFRGWGYETEIERFDVLFPTPKTRLLEMTSPEKFTARLQEPALKQDGTSAVRENQLPVYNAYSIDGEVTAQLVYVNYGVPKDYETLASRGVEVKGKIVLARYGGSWRGIKPKVAAEQGALGCVIFSDPKDDGYFQGDVYPKGSWRNEHGAQRGSVADMPLYPGDPLTPGVGATPDAKRLDIKDAQTLTRIPVLPISYAEALPLLRSLAGPVAPEEWRGALPVTYHLGPGPATVHLKLEFDWKLVPTYNVIAKLAGTERPEQWVIRGNHHDAWNFGAADPTSGQIAMMEEARGISELVKTGWKPRRTIVYAAWDGEEPGLLGSTEWVETHAEFLRKNAAIYINSDSNARGFLGMGGSHTLQKFMNEVAREVIDPQKNISVLERARAAVVVNGSKEDRRVAREHPDLKIVALGSGSDYTPFLQHLGVPSLNLGYGGEGGGGSYHSIYDSFDHYTRFGDPTFEYGITLAQTAGRAVLRMANAEILPFEFLSFSDTVARYVKELASLADDLREETDEINRQIQEGFLTAFFNPQEPYVMPEPKSKVPHLNFAPLENAIGVLDDVSRQYRDTLERSAPGSLSGGLEASIDKILLGTERVMTQKAGLPGRPWFTHQIYAPGLYTGYGVKTLPGVREAIERRNWKEVEEQVAIAAQTIENVAKEIKKAVDLLRGGTKN